jgi:nucleoside-diphosphate-sugar epimerase
VASGPRVFIAGAHTYLGARVAAVCQERDFEVVCLAHENQETYALEAIGVEIARGSVLEPDTFKGLLKRCDWAINLHRNVDFSLEPPKKGSKEEGEHAHRTMHAINVEGAVNFLDTCIAMDVPKVLTLSAMLAIGDHRGQLADERFDHRRQFRSYYEQTMYDALFQTRRRIEDGAQIACVLPGPVLGPRAEGIFTTLVEDFVRGRLSWGISGNSQMTWTYIDDIVRGIFQIMDKRVPVGLYMFGNEPVTWEEFFRKIAKVGGFEPKDGWVNEGVLGASLKGSYFLSGLRGKKPVLPKEMLPYIVDAQYKFSSAKAQKEIGWDFTTMEIWLAEIIEDMRSEAPTTQAAIETFTRSSLPAGY